jgi:predicted transcriptional regulator
MSYKYEKEEPRIIELYHEGKTVKEISELLNMPYGAVRYITYKNGLRSSEKNHQVSAERRRIAREMVQQGYKVKEIAEHLGISRVTVRTYTLDLRYNSLDGIEEEVVKRIKNGDTKASIQREFKITRRRVDSICKKHGISRPKRVFTEEPFDVDLDQLMPKASFPPTDEFELYKRERARLEEVRAAKIRNWERLHKRKETKK